MRNLVFCALFAILVCGCRTSITSPVTKAEYTGAIERKGMNLNVKPPFWDKIADYYNKYILREKSKKADK